MLLSEEEERMQLFYREGVSKKWPGEARGTVTTAIGLSRNANVLRRAYVRMPHS